jgi:hypothetical protein
LQQVNGAGPARCERWHATTLRQSLGAGFLYLSHDIATGAATATYIKADLHAVATALAAMTGQPHPLAHP